MPHITPRPSAFSLVELSVVLVIIGLLVGGVMTGQTLVHASELRNATISLGKYVAAINSFQAQYKALPGDMTNATSFWGAANTNFATCTTTSTGTQATCDGNGDGQINGSTTSGSTSRYEIYRAWQHLANAGLIEGSYSGISAPVAGNGGYSSAPGVNTPISKIKGGGYDFYNPGNAGASSTTYFPANYGNVIVYGRAQSTTDIAIYNLLTPEDAYNIDLKLDDGKPGTGMILPPLNASMWGTSCSTTNDPATAEYKLTQTTVGCSLLTLTGYTF